MAIKHIVAASDLGPCGEIVIITTCHPNAVEMESCSLFASIVGDDASSLAKLLRGDGTLIVKTRHVRPQIVVAVVNALASIEVNVDIHELGLEGFGTSIIHNLDCFRQVNLCAVRSAHCGHLLDAVH